MNGPFAAPDEMIDDPHVTDYSMAKDVVYCGFAWSLAEEAYRRMRDSTAKCGVGFFNVSADDGEIIFPDLINFEKAKPVSSANAGSASRPRPNFAIPA